MTRTGATPQSGDCAGCAHFIDEPLALERALPGLTILSSAYGSTRGRCGICQVRNTFQDPEADCARFEPRLPASGGLGSGRYGEVTRRVSDACPSAKNDTPIPGRSGS